MKKVEGKMKNSAGLTLLELIFVIAIISILSAISIASFSPIKKRTGLQAALDEVSSSLNLAKSYALQGKTLEGVSGPICGYGFGFPDSSQPGEYEVFYYYPKDGETTSLCGSISTIKIGDTPVLKQELQNRAVISTSSHTIANGYAVYFSIPFAQVMFYSQTHHNFDIKYSDLSASVSVSSRGLIQ